MKWEGREESKNVEDRRGLSAKVGLGVGGGIIVLLLALAFGVDPQKLAGLFGPGGPGGEQVQPKGPIDPEEEKQARFSKVVFRDTEDIWTDLFRKMNKSYKNPTLVLFSDRVDSACGAADAAVGPFYCPGDHKIYIDLSFYRDMERKLNSPGEFARAYVIAHEVGHHVQNLLGYSDIVHQARGAKSKTEVNRLTVRLELQADYLAGVWAHHAQAKLKFLEPGDIESALNAAFEIGDDRLQKKGRGVVVPDSFTHGTSRQRMRWFQAGFQSGDVNKAADLFRLRYDDL